MQTRRVELGYLAGLLLFCCVLVLARMRYSGTIHYYFLIWNLFLAVIPLLIALFYKTTSKHWPGKLWLMLCLSLWLLFFPNAPYIATDLRHLGYHPYMPRWFDPMMVFSAAITGLMAGFLSLREFEQEIKQRSSSFWAHIFVIKIWFLSGLGIYLGRVLRWNSWDLFQKPAQLFVDALKPFMNPQDYTNALGIIGSYSVLFLLLYRLWNSHQGSGKDELRIENGSMKKPKSP